MEVTPEVIDKIQEIAQENKLSLMQAARVYVDNHFRGVYIKERRVFTGENK